MQAAEHTVEAIRAVLLFRELGPAELDALAHQVVQRRYGRNEVIFSQADRGDGLYIVVSGHVSIGRQNPDGDELIFAMYEAGEYFGELALFDQEPRAAGATSVDESSLLFLSRHNFRTFMDSHPGALWTCLAVVVAQLRRCTDLADEIALLDVRSRLARRLLRLAREGMISGGNAGAHDPTFRITQQQLANMTGATRESVNKHLNAFVDDGLIRLDRGRITLVDLARLEQASIGAG
jgi:CRP/FNR family transcriptional regulator, cyclic AMP receptor protein